MGRYWASDTLPHEIDLPFDVQGVHELRQLPNHEQLIVRGVIAGGETAAIDVVRQDGVGCYQGRGELTNV